MKNIIQKSNFYIVIALFALLFNNCARNPVTGKKQLVLMSEAQEINIGKTNDPAVVAQFGLYNNKKIQDFINVKGQQMAKISHRPNLPFEFKVLDSPVVNAFALPGGYVYFTRGILAHFNNEAEFAGVLGHEIGHVTARHGVSQMTNQQLAQLGFIVGIVASKEFRQFANEASQAMQLMFLKFGRNDETESDGLGVEYSTKVGYDAHEMAEFFNTLKRMQEKSGQSIPEFMSTHPDPGNRYERVHKLADEEQAKSRRSNLKVNRESYLRLIDGLTYGEDPKQGYVERDVFYHPELKFEYPVPSGWRTANSPMQVQHAPQDGKAFIVFSAGDGSVSLDKTAQELVTKHKLNVVNDKKLKVNGFDALAFVADQTNEQSGQVIRLMTYIIKYGRINYVFHGIADQREFNSYSRLFENTFKGFRKLTDPAKINVKAERIKIATVKSTGTLSSALKSFNMANDRLNELSIVNGMQLNDQVKKGDLIKIVVK